MYFVGMKINHVIIIFNVSIRDSNDLSIECLMIDYVLYSILFLKYPYVSKDRFKSEFLSRFHFRNVWVFFRCNINCR